MDEAWWNAETLTGFQTEAIARFVVPCLSVDLNRKIVIRALTFGIGLKKTNQDVPATTVDNIFHLMTMKMEWRFLILRIENQLFCIVFARAELRRSVSQRKKRSTKLFKTALSKVGYVPAKHRMANFITLRPFRLPVLYGPRRERWQGEPNGGKGFRGNLDRLIND